MKKYSYKESSKENIKEADYAPVLDKIIVKYLKQQGISLTYIEETMNEVHRQIDLIAKAYKDSSSKGNAYLRLLQKLYARIAPKIKEK